MEVGGGRSGVGIGAITLAEARLIACLEVLLLHAHWKRVFGQLKCGFVEPPDGVKRSMALKWTACLPAGVIKARKAHSSAKTPTQRVDEALKLFIFTPKCWRTKVASQTVGDVVLT